MDKLIVPYLSYFGDLNIWSQLICTEKVYTPNRHSYRLLPKGSINRTTLLSSQGILYLSIPIQGGRKNKLPLQDIKIDYTIKWQQQHFKTIKSCYGKAPYWQDYEADIQKIYTQYIPLLIDWNKMIFEWIASLLHLKLTYFERLSIHSEKSIIEIKPYQQIFGDHFYSEVSILDTILNKGEREAKQSL